jgi:hypothetical protein
MQKLILLKFFILYFFYCKAQNVGIGTSTPSEKLEVSGNIKTDTVKPAAIKLTPNAGTGKILTSDALGNAQWVQSSTTAGNVGYGLWGDCATNGSISEYLPVADSATQPSALLGRSVSVSGNFAFIGIPALRVGVNSSQGAVIVYRYENNGWVYFSTLTDAAGAAGDQFGYSVCADGNYAIIGSYEDDIAANSNQGSASIFQYNGTYWVFMQRLTDASGAALDRFGASVSIAGNRAIVGAPYDDDGANFNEGSASIFQYNGASWVLMTKLTHSSGATQDSFGFSVAISGDKAIIGSPFANNSSPAASDAGRASIYHFNTTWIPVFDIPASDVTDDNEGYSVALYNNYAVIGRPGRNSNAGDALAYFFDGANWLLLDTLTRPSVAAGDFFGSSVSISGNYILIGAPKDDVSPNTDEGGVSLFTRIGNFWQQQQYITDPAGSTGNSGGTSVAIDGASKRFIIGVPGAFDSRGKALFGKVN